MKISLVFLLPLIFLAACSGNKKSELTNILPKVSTLPLSLCPLILKDKSTFNLSNRKALRVLAVDGGGVRGIIPARILAELELRSGKPITELFDLMVGNSTGGLIVLGLNIPDENGKPKYSAIDLVNLYNQKSRQIFKTSLIRKIYTGFGLWAPKYDRTYYDAVLKDFFGDIRMSELLKPTGVISYNLSTGLPHLWSSEYARKRPNRDFYVRDIAGATSAAPTYFAPKLLVDNDNNLEYQADGGIFANNPESAAISMAFELNNKLKRENIILISLGTGTIKLNTQASKLKDAGIIGWVIKDNLIDVMMNAQSEWYDSEVGEEYYNSCRIQLLLNKKLSAMDDTSTSHLKSLLRSAEDYISSNSELIDKIVNILNNR